MTSAADAWGPLAPQASARCASTTAGTATRGSGTGTGAAAADEAARLFSALKACDLDALLGTVQAAVTQRDRLERAQLRYRAGDLRGEAALAAQSAVGRAVLEDLVDLLERTQGLANQEADTAPGVRLPPSVLKHRRQYLWGLAWDAVLELMNTGGDVLFLAAMS